MSYFPKPSLNENDLAIIERGDTAVHSIEAGKYVSWHGRTGKAKADILQGATLSDSLFDYDEDGALNKISTKLVTQFHYNANPTDITIQEDGIYLVFFSSYCGVGQYGGIKQNGTIMFRGSLDNSGGSKICSGVLTCAKDDVISFYIEGGYGLPNDIKLNNCFILKIG